MKALDYSQQHDEFLRDKTQELIRTLPKFLEMYFIAKSDLLPSTQLNYATDLAVFFEWLRDREEALSDIQVRDIPFDALKRVTSDDINVYIKSYLTKYERAGVIHRNDYNGKARKLSSLRSMFKYYLVNKEIDSDPCAVIELRARDDHEIVYLQPNEVAILLDAIDEGTECESSNKRKAAWHKRNRSRDLAIITMLLGTGMRVSECVGLNIEDIDFDDGAIHIMRKGHRRDTVYMGEEIEETLHDYMDHSRTDNYSPADEEKALFLSSRGTRITVRSVEILLKKYVQAALPYRSGEKISPHKMRSTFGTTLYKETGDIKLVADALGHKNIATTQKHYAASDTEIKRSAFRNVRLRDGGEKS